MQLHSLPPQSTNCRAPRVRCRNIGPAPPVFNRAVTTPSDEADDILLCRAERHTVVLRIIHTVVESEMSDTQQALGAVNSECREHDMEWRGSKITSEYQEWKLQATVLSAASSTSC